ncbi:hypothetical protein pdam_00007588 [Pocillopora damicornis]|uniref:Uncharacterized protein n=1 Tax=Pocillopora damicornis TaxID=46731 RepID=A0A3M6TDJ0_POCDA|nr:hypothetical protein pdam_00007588 [Pocillopora damicornis]
MACYTDTDVAQGIKPIQALLTYTVAVCSLPCSKNWSRLATCLGMDLNKSFSDDIIRFIHRRGYMIVPPSNPPTQKQGSYTKRSIYSGRCPFTFAVKDFIDTVPRFVSYATCSGCDVRCKAVPYTVSLLRRKCGDYWLWEERDIQAAYILEI